jgi:hypothetical protein
MADEDGWAATPPQRTSYCCNIALKCVEAVLSGYHIMPLRLQRGMTLLKYEPSAHNPCANTMLGLDFVGTTD